MASKRNLCATRRTKSGSADKRCNTGLSRTYKQRSASKKR